MNMACLVFSKIDTACVYKDIEKDVQTKLETFREQLYSNYRFGFENGFLFSKFNAIGETVYSNPKNAYIEPLCEQIQQYVQSKDGLEYDVMVNFDFIDRVDFAHKHANKIFHYITHDGQLKRFLIESDDKNKLSKQFYQSFLEYVNNLQENNPRETFYVTVVDCQY